MTATLYHLSIGGNVTGPYTAPQVRTMWNSGGITADAFCIKHGDQDWRPIHEMQELTGSQASAVIVAKEDPFASLHTPIKGRSQGSLTWIGWAGIVIGVISAPLVLFYGLGIPGALLGIASYLWCRK